MTLSEINTKIGNLVNDTSSAAYTAAARLIDINLWNNKISSMILDSQDEAGWDDYNQSAYPIFKVPLTTNRDITVPQTIRILKIKSVSVCYDGVHIYRANPYDNDTSPLPVSDAANTTAQANIDAFMSRVNPKVDVKYNSLWLYPMATAADVTAGGYVMFECFRAPYNFTSSDLTTGTLIPGFDESFHGMLAYGAAVEYATAKQLPQLKNLQATLQDYEARLRQQYSSKQLDRRYALEPDYQNFK